MSVLQDFMSNLDGTTAQPATPTPAATPTPTTTNTTPTPTPTTGGVQTNPGSIVSPVPAPTAGTPTPAATPPATPVAGYTNGQYAPQDDSVTKQVDALTSRANPLMTRARGIGMAVANARGLQNSSIAAQSAEKSMLDAAVPIASQEAQQIYGKNLQYQQGKSQSEIASMQTAAAAQSAFAQALLSASSSYSSNVSAIMSNPDLKSSARQSALNAAAAQRNADYVMIQNVYGVSLSGIAWAALAVSAGRAADAAPRQTARRRPHRRPARGNACALALCGAAVRPALHARARRPGDPAQHRQPRRRLPGRRSRSSTSGSRRSSSAR
jgi:hypothetical protein